MALLQQRVVMMLSRSTANICCSSGSTAPSNTVMMTLGVNITPVLMSRALSAGIWAGRGGIHDEQTLRSFASDSTTSAAVTTPKEEDDLRGPRPVPSEPVPTAAQLARMGSLKYYKPTTPGQRGRIGISREGLWKGEPYAPLVTGKGMAKTGGRNNTGRITVWHRGGGTKRLYRLVDFARTEQGEDEATVLRIEYDPNRSARIALIQAHGRKPSYIIAPEGLHPGHVVRASANAPPTGVGNTLPLAKIPVGLNIHNVELEPGRGGQLCRSAGSSCTIVKKESAASDIETSGGGDDAANPVQTKIKGFATLRLASGELRLVPMACKATVGVVSNKNHNKQVLGKAGASRWRGIRPTVRGVAMNPIDHPHGGGEGKTAGGRPSVTPWGKPTKGALTFSLLLFSRVLLHFCTSIATFCLFAAIVHEGMCKHVRFSLSSLASLAFVYECVILR